MDVDKLRSQLGIEDLLVSVEAEIAREHIGDAARERRNHLPRTEQLDAEDDRGDRTVDRAAEHAHEPERGEPRRDAEQTAEHAAERCAE